MSFQGSKCNIKITKKVPYDTVVSKSKLNNAIIPAARAQSLRSAVPSASVEVKCEELVRILSTKLLHAIIEANCEIYWYSSLSHIHSTIDLHLGSQEFYYWFTSWFNCVVFL